MMLKTKYLLPLILILLLTFTLIGDCGWLAGWDYRIELEIADYAGDIGGEVVWFPVDVFLTGSQAQEVFVELTTDAEYKKIQFTQADGTSLLYGHMKLFDVSETKGIFTVSATGWTINANTSIFLYYDSTHTDNDTYIGAINTAACEAVYNAEYKAVYTMADGVDNAHIYDATSNNNDGTKGAAGEPTEAAGKVGQAQDFDGDDYITIPTADTLKFGTGDFTIETIVNTSSADTETQISYGDRYNNPGWTAYIGAVGVAKFIIDDGTTQVVIEDEADWIGAYHSYAASMDRDGNGIVYIDGASVKSASIAGANLTLDTVDHDDIEIGRAWWSSGYVYLFSGILDEIRISKGAARSAAWVKGTHNSSWDTLLTYGSEETKPSVTNIMFIFSDF